MCILNHLNPVKSFVWCENTSNLAIAAGKNKVYFWSPQGCSVCDLPYEGRQLNVNKLDWSKNGKLMVL